jgi:hypothetical protein
MSEKLLRQSDDAAEIARNAFAAGDLATGIAAIQLAAQLVQLARLLALSPSKDAGK